MVLLFRYLALVYLMRDEDKANKPGLVDYNISCFKQAINELFEAKKGRAKPTSKRVPVPPPN